MYLSTEQITGMLPAMNTTNDECASKYPVMK